MSPINRLSIGVQSFFEKDLILMNRAHNSQEAKNCLSIATQYFKNISVDLIYGIPNCTNQEWLENIRMALSFGISHISSYALTVEPKTALESLIKKGKIEMTSDQVAQEQFHLLTDELEKHHFVHYELSNFGKENYFSKNNTAYWLGKSYLGFGPSAHSFDGKKRSWNIRNNVTYIKSLQADQLPIEREVLTKTDQYNEYIMTGLRTIWGVSLQKIEQNFGKNYRTYLQNQSKKYIQQDLLYFEDKILKTNLWSSELSKLTANAFLAQRISSINAISELCEHTGANVNEVAKAIGMDSRIGSKFLNASIGFGGSCFQKDILNLVYIARSFNLNAVADYWEQVIILNDHQKRRFSDRLIKTLYNTVSGKKIGFLGWAFKKDTNDTRESAAIYVADHLLSEQASVVVYDPKVSNIKMQSDINYLKTRTKDENKEGLMTVASPYEALKDAHAVAIMTEWDEFKDYDWDKIYNDMKKPAFIFDGRNILDKSKMEAIGFEYYAIGQ